MSMTPEEERLLDDYSFQRGTLGGNLALAMDLLTDVQALIAQHKLYCRLEKGPREGEGTLDVEEAVRLVDVIKSRLRESLVLSEKFPDGEQRPRPVDG
ncbi:hypothetical protein Pan216_00600 [Planctomycetes bacterium Pan216]|uniref:Uncharacterized protein n=1 Tax=Kolteria novifilia TaxID=2527975 RepID=A0A518AWY2_9BACT|nr:hypothetical protein Pan216_00600 [Planctomycetes bacterium Pan216]